MPDTKKRIILWGGWYGSYNVGDRLLLVTIADIISKVIGPVHYIILSARPSLVREYFKPAAGSSYEVLNTKQQLLRVVQELARCDLFIQGGGVPFFDQPKQIAILLFFSALLKIFNHPYLLWCVSSLSIHRPISKAIVRWVVDGAAAVTVRDVYTQQVFTGCGTKTPGKIVADSAFGLNTFNLDNAQIIFQKYLANVSPDRLFALTPRTLRCQDDEAQTHYEDKNKGEVEHELATYSIALDWLVEHGYTPVFIPMNTIAPDDDREASKQIIARARHGDKAILVDEAVGETTSPAFFRNILGSLVSRVHGSVTSSLGGCPVIMYAFENKHKGIMESMGLNDYIFDPKTEPAENITQYLEKQLAQTSHLREYLKTRLEELGLNARLPAELAQQILNKSS